MADEIDEAQEREENYIKQAIAMAKCMNVDDDDPLIIDGKRCCLDCEKPIPKNRLKLQPRALRCVSCQTKKEKNYAKRRK